MPALITGLGKVADFISLIAQFVEQSKAFVLHLCRFISVGQNDPALFNVLIHRRMLIQDQRIRGDMLCVQLCCGLDAVEIRFHGLLGKTMHKINVNIVETGFAGCLECGNKSV